MKLLCDHMLGTLARWLRFMGYDTAYPDPGPDRALIELAEAEGRVLLTRDKELASRVRGAVRIRSDNLEEQIHEAAAVLPLRLVDPLSRCSLCNEVLVPASKDAVTDFVPADVRARLQDYWQCPACKRVYWQGSHWNKMVERLNDLRLPPA